MRSGWMMAALVVAAPAMAQTPRRDAPRSYTGTAGANPIVLTLESEDAAPNASGTRDIWGSYFYAAHRLDIRLQGKRRGDTITLDAMPTDDHLVLRRVGPRLVGTLTTAAHRRFAVSLSPVTQARDVPAAAPADLSLHEKLQLAGLTLAPDGDAVVDGRPIRWLRERLSGVRLFRLGGGYAPGVVRTINAALDQQQWRNVRATLGCTGGDGKPGVEGAVAGKPWLGRDYVSYAWHADWSCAGAAHPDFMTEGHSFDARTGRELTLDAVLPVGAATPPPPDSDGWYRYRSDIFGPAVVRLLQRYHPAQMKPQRARDSADDAPDCDYADPGVWSFPAWRLTPDGLWLGASFARVARVCDNPEWAVLPWSALPARAAAP